MLQAIALGMARPLSLSPPRALQRMDMDVDVDMEMEGFPDQKEV